MMKTLYKTMVIALGTIAFTSSDVLSQTTVDLDVMSRFVWRGHDFGNSPSLQPGVTYAAGGLELGGWAAIPTTGDPEGSEIDWFVSYSLPLGNGTAQFVLTDYSFPEPRTGSYFDLESHYLEAGFGYEGPDNLPVSLFTGVFLTNDDDYSVYIEAGYQIANFDLFAGFTPSKSELYGTEGAGLINTGISTGKEVAITDRFNITLTTSAIFNIYAQEAFFLFGISL